MPEAIMFDYRNTSFEIRDGQPTLALLPIASIEQHGAHLPLATDLILMEAITRGVADAMTETTFTLPVFPYGTSLSQAAFAGTIWLTADTLLSVVHDVVESLYEHGIQRVAVLNNHGGANETSVVPRGNFVVKTAVRQLNYDYPDRDAIWVQPFTAARDELRAIFGSAAEEVHAGEIETSLLLALQADVKPERPPDFIPDVSRDYLNFVAFDRISPSGVWGRPRLANEENGKRALKAAIDGTIRYISESFLQLDRAKGRLASHT
jgi:creatinine amidohydrolase